MNEFELMQMIQDHYLGEAQLLTMGAEDNLLKLAELRGNMTEEQSARWAQIKRDFLRNKAMGGDEGDVGGKVVAQLADLVDGLQDLKAVVEESKVKPELVDVVDAVVDDSEESDDSISSEHISSEPISSEPISSELITAEMDRLVAVLKGNQPNVEVINQPVPGISKILSVLANTIEQSLMPVVMSMDKKLDIDLRTHHKMSDISEQLRKLQKEMGIKSNADAGVHAENHTDNKTSDD